MIKDFFNLEFLQNSDSFFPSGSVSFSWGLENLVNQNIIQNDHDLKYFIISIIENRWFCFDLPVLKFSSRNISMEKLIKFDKLVEAQTLPFEQRLGSKKLGFTMLSIHEKLETPGAIKLLNNVKNKKTYGHLNIVQGFIWNKLGFKFSKIKLISIHTLCTSLLSAAVRLSLIGYLEAQKVYKEIQPKINQILKKPIKNIQEIYSFTPHIDIASMKHENDKQRMFMN